MFCYNNTKMQEYEIDNKWLREIKDNEKDYNDFYKEKPTSIKIYHLYVSRDNQVHFSKTETYLLNITDGKHATLHKDTLISIIKKNSSCNNIQYKLLSLLKFNLDIDPEDVISLAIHKKDGSEYLSSESVLRDIVFNDTVCIFQDINSLFMVYYEKIHANQQENKQSMGQAQQSMGQVQTKQQSMGQAQQSTGQTRKIYFNSTTTKKNMRKTISKSNSNINAKNITKKLQILID